ncbi:MAG TPA: hypothetical protein VK324_13275 [Tepidisphaeraceae bacterium]|nr:hypothetical protein [Tepidisphaeraceae bacterium]
MNGFDFAAEPVGSFLRFAIRGDAMLPGYPTGTTVEARKVDAAAPLVAGEDYYVLSGDGRRTFAPFIALYQGCLCFGSPANAGRGVVDWLILPEQVAGLAVAVATVRNRRAEEQKAARRKSPSSPRVAARATGRPGERRPPEGV